MSRKKHNKKTGLGKVVDANRIDEILAEEIKKNEDEIHLKHKDSNSASNEKPEY